MAERRTGRKLESCATVCSRLSLFGDGKAEYVEGEGGLSTGKKKIPDPPVCFGDTNTGHRNRAQEDSLTPCRDHRLQHCPRGRWEITHDRRYKSSADGNRKSKSESCQETGSDRVEINYLSLPNRELGLKMKVDSKIGSKLQRYVNVQSFTTTNTRSVGSTPTPVFKGF